MITAPVRQGTASQAIRDLAAALLSRQRAVVDAVARQRAGLDAVGVALDGVASRLRALRAALETLLRAGTLSPFAAMRATSSQPDALEATASPAAGPGVVEVAVQQLARRATHASDVYVDGAGLIASQGLGTFTFIITVAGIDYPVTVTIAAGDTDARVLDNVAAAVTAAAGEAVSAQRVATATGESRLVLASRTTGTSHKLVFTDTDGLLARLGIVHATPTAATATTGGYLAEDLGNHELDAQLTVDGLAYVRETNTVSDLLSGVALTLRAPTAGPASVQIAPDGGPGLDAIRAFVRAWNDLVGFLRAQSAVDPQRHTAGPLAQDLLTRTALAQLRAQATARVASAPAGGPDSLAALGIRATRDGTLTIASEADLAATIAATPTAVAEVFRAADGVARRLVALADQLGGPSGAFASSRAQVTGRLRALDGQLARLNERLAAEQARWETRLARSEALLRALTEQQAALNAMLSDFGLG